MFLSDDELKTLTGKVRWCAQVRALVAMGIEFERRPDGKPVVLKAAIEPASNDAGNGGQPKWDAA